MNTYVVLMRGINVGGKNKIPMADLKRCLEEQGFESVITYIQSGNVILRSDLDAEVLSAKIEDLLPRKFKLDSSLIRVVAFEYDTYKEIVTQAPKEFGKDSASYRYNVLFLMNFSSSKAIEQVSTRQGVDDVWQGENALFFRNTVQNASKSHLSRITQQPVYQSMTIRNWNTTTKLLDLLEELRKGVTVSDELTRA
jgi:uncharacterized protein (DUF1697 family)